MSFNSVLPSDVHALKARVAPSVALVTSRVRRATALATELRAQWQAFAAEWADYAGDTLSVFSPSNYEKGITLEGKLRELKSVLSSQCPGVSPPAAKHPSSFFGTWASSSDVRTQKNRTDTLFRELNMAMAASSTLDADARREWGNFFRAWVEFFNSEDSWIHGATLFECAVAYEDTLPEWRDVLDLANDVAAGTSSNLPPTSPIVGYPPPPFILPPLGAGPSLPSPSSAGFGGAASVIGVMVLLGLGLALSRGK